MAYTLALDPCTNSSITINLYKYVANLKDLQDQVTSGALNCCIVNPSLIVHPFQIAVAANKALVSDKLITKTIYTELLFNLSISKNITQSLQKFGFGNKENNILVVVIHDSGSDNTNEVFEKVLGEKVDISVLSELTSFAEVKNLYKLGDEEMKDLCILDSVVSKIATKDVI